MVKIHCDGCGTEFTGLSEPALRGKRANGMGGGGMPQGDFHLCSDCGRFAFDALRQRAKVARS